MLFFVNKEKHQKKNFARKAYALRVFLAILPLLLSVQRKAVTHRVCNGFLPGQNTTRRVLDELYN